MNIEQRIVTQLEKIFSEEQLPVPEFNYDTVLLNMGLDSLAFAILVVRLESELGIDPFTLSDEPIYPKTLKDFISIYEKFL